MLLSKRSFAMATISLAIVVLGRGSVIIVECDVTTLRAHALV
jgi:hypothetical protein